MSEAAVRSAFIGRENTRGRPHDRDRTRQAIIDAARRLAAGTGDGKLTLSGVAAEAGFASGTVYGYFRNKQELLQAASVADVRQDGQQSAEPVFIKTAQPRRTSPDSEAETSHEFKFVSKRFPGATTSTTSLGTDPRTSDGPREVKEETVLRNADAKPSAVFNGEADRSIIETSYASDDSIAEATPLKPRGKPLAETSSALPAEVTKRSIRRGSNDTTSFAENKSAVLRPAIQGAPNGDRAGIDAIIDRLVVPPALPGSTPAMVSRFERRVDLIESELAKIGIQQTELGQRLDGVAAATYEKASVFAAKLEATDQRRLISVSELRGEIFELSLRIRTLEGNAGAAINSDIPVLPSADESFEADTLILTDAPDSNATPPPHLGEQGKPETYLSMARQSANMAAAATTGHKDESRRDIKRYLLLGGVAIFALIAAVAAFHKKAATQTGRVTMPEHAALLRHKNVVRKTAAPAFAQNASAQGGSQNVSLARPPGLVRQANFPAVSQVTIAKPPPTEPVTRQEAKLQSNVSPNLGGFLSKAVAPLDKLSRLAQSGNAQAELAIGLKYLDGHPSPENSKRAMHWLELASAKGLPVAQYRLGNIYQHGLVGPVDRLKAMHWYKAAAAGGNVKAMYNLAFGHAEGWDGHQDYTEAARWFSAAARRGYVDAQFNLAILYERGEGLPQSLLDAYKWYSIAAQQGDRGGAKRVEMIAPQLSASELEAGHWAIVSFRPEPTKKAANAVLPVTNLLGING